MGHPQTSANSRKTNKPGIYSYAVRAVGPLQHVAAGTPAARLSFEGELRTKDGQTRLQPVIVENTDDNPHLVSNVADALRRGDPARLLVSFTRRADTGVHSRLRLSAVAKVQMITEPRLEDPRQLLLFG
ncbi:hypothetical protein [Sphingosinicella sp. BN140058]|uniref:hypothetical protein n=1 Tax=Sphingosinicella sp. BN140058 TaxID=1892855 RepID=UPI0010101825|nr:hypothetical protein [Sphingosinicella sp. BN140058]QAY80312.1 hypothetical protein ETR14_27090 [Sphingosinicella sp. BN140058]